MYCSRGLFWFGFGLGFMPWYMYLFKAATIMDKVEDKALCGFGLCVLWWRCGKLRWLCGGLCHSGRWEDYFYSQYL